MVLGIVVGGAPVGAASPTPVPSPTASAVPVAVVGELWISEVVPNPVGTDTGNEWVELHNRTSHPVAIGGLVVARLSGTTLLTVSAGTVLAADAYLKLTATGSIVNGGDTLILKLGTVEYDRITYDAVGAEGQSWARLTETVGEWTDTPTPDAANAFPDLADDSDDLATAVSASTSGSSSQSAKSATSKKATASKLPKSGPGLLGYLILPLAWAVYGYGRKYYQDHADRR